MPRAASFRRRRALFRQQQRLRIARRPVGRRRARDPGTLACTQHGFPFAVAHEIGAQGRIVIAASRLDVNDGALGIVLAAFTGDGLPDATFANRGRPFVALSGIASAAALAQDPHGRLVVAGTFRRAPGQLSDIVVLRRLSSDAADGAFGGKGIARGREGRRLQVRRSPRARSS